MSNETQLFDALNKYFSKKDFYGLIDYCTSEIKFQESNYLLFGARGKAFYEIEKFEEAVLDISKSIKLNPSYVLGLYNRGLCYYQLEKYFLAIKDFVSFKLSEAETRNVDFYLGACNYFIHDYKKSIEYFSNYLLFFDDEIALKWRADIYILTEQYAKANTDIFQLLLYEIKNIETYQKINEIVDVENRIVSKNSATQLIIDNGFNKLKDEKYSGVYILEFNNFEFYVGKAKKIQIRIRQHLKKYNDIVNIYFKPFAEDHLLIEETKTIGAFEINGIRIRNLKQIEFLNLFPKTQQDLWINNLNFNITKGPKFCNTELKIKFRDRYLKLQEKEYFEIIVLLLRKYIAKTIPNYLASEFNYWNLTCLPNYLKKSNCISRININSVPVLSIFEEDDKTLTFMLYVSKLPFLKFIKENNNTLQSFFETIPSISINLRNAFEEKTEKDEMTVLISEKDFESALDNKLLLSSIRTFNLRMMNRIGKEEKYRRSVSHCLDLTDKILISETLSHKVCKLKS